MVDEKTFEQALKELEEVVSRLEEGQIPLDEALSCFEAGIKNVNICRDKLKAVESRVEILMKDASGEYSVENFSVESDED